MRYSIRRSDNREMVTTEIKSVAVLAAAYLSVYDETDVTVTDTKRNNEVLCTVSNGIPNEVSTRYDLQDSLKGILKNLLDSDE